MSDSELSEFKWMLTPIDMNIRILHIAETDSTNVCIKKYLGENEAEGLVVSTDFQTSGKGQTGNSWESEAGKNLLFSLLLRPVGLPISSQFLISMLVSVGVVKYLQQYIGDLSIKWPNDIYYQDKKLGGILIENTWQGSVVSSSIIGIGLNINQSAFKSNAPNPVSMFQISGKEFDRGDILNGILQQIDALYSTFSEEKIAELYHQMLYRKDGYHLYMDENERFAARIEKVENDGRLVLITQSDIRKEFYFKEVSFVI